MPSDAGQGYGVDFLFLEHLEGIIDIPAVAHRHDLLADLVDAVNVARALPLTYSLYRDAKMGKARLNPVHAAPAKPGAVAEVWQCTVCHYIYDGDIPFNELPDDYTCPLCGVGKEFFEKL